MCEETAECPCCGNKPLRRWRMTGDNVSYPADCDRIIKVARGIGWDLNRAEAEHLWECVSGERCAQWLGLPPDHHSYEDYGEVMVEDGLIHLVREFLEG